jgi:hypothetical protein
VGVSSSGQPDEDGGVLQVTSASVESVTASELGDDVDGVEAAIYVAGAAADASDSDEVTSALDSLPAPPSPQDDCRTRRPLVNPVGWEIDYAGCNAHGSAGVVNIRRQQGGDGYLVEFTDTFFFRGVKVAGWALLTKRESKHYRLSSAASDGAQVAQALIRVSRQGPSRTVVRDLRVGGDLDVVDSPFKAFDYGAEGTVLDPDGVRQHGLGLGGLPGGAKSSPLRFRRPADGRCPEAGVLTMRGHFLLRLAFVYAVVIRDQRYDVQVDLGPRDFDGGLRMVFDASQGSGLGELDLRPDVSIRADKERVREAVRASVHEGRIKDAIISHVDASEAPLVPDDAFAAAARVVLALLFTDGNLCARN